MMKLYSSIASWLLLLSGGVSAQLPWFEVLQGPVPARGGLIDAAGDVDGDGDTDLVSAQGLLLNDGHGTFQPAIPGVLSGGRHVIFLADFNGDGLLDEASQLNSTLRIAFQGPGLTFVAQPSALPLLTLSTGVTGSVGKLTAGDVDGDGDLDLLVEAFSSSAVELLVLTNGGTGTLTLSSSVPLADRSVEIIMADFDGDSDLDVAVVEVWPGNRLLWFANLGASFGPAQVIPTSFGVSSLRSGDFNGDGIADLAFLVSGDIEIRPGTSSGPGPGAVSSFAGPVRDMVAIDLDGDSRDEIVVELPSPDGLSVHAVDTSGAIGGRTQFFPSLNLGNFFFEVPGPVADLDGDGDPDLVADTPMRVPVLLMNDGAGSLTRVGNAEADTAGPRPQVGDIDGDGDLDVVRAWGISTNTTGLIETLRNDGRGGFSTGPRSPWPAGLQRLSIHGFDRDGDGDMDLYAYHNLEAVPAIAVSDLVFDNVGGRFQVAFSLPPVLPVSQVRHADFDGDGDQDLVLARRAQLPGAPALSLAMIYRENLGAAGFAAGVPIGTNHSTFDLEVADFDGDGDSDVLQVNLAASGDPCVLYVNDGSGSFSAVIQTNLTGYYAASGDVDLDGLPDVVLDDRVWINDGAYGFVPGPMLAVVLRAPPELVDLDGDGDLDLLETPSTVMPNQGGGVFLPPVVSISRWDFTGYPIHTPVSGLGDLDRDGDIDVVGGDGRIHRNKTRQILPWGVPRPGRPASLQLSGASGSTYWLFVAAGPGFLPSPPYGTLLLDPTTLLFAQTGTFTGTDVVYSATLPNDPTLVGLAPSWQMMVGTRLSNAVRTRAWGY